MSTAAQRQTQHRRIDVGAIDDDAKPRAGAFECSRNGTGLPAGERTHGVEQVSEARKTFSERSSGLGVGGHGMPQSDANAALRQVVYETSSHLLGCECHER